MSRIVTIRGELIIENIEIAQKAIEICMMRNVKIINSRFVYSGEMRYETNDKTYGIDTLENRYKLLLKEFYLKIAEEKRILEEIELQRRLEQEIKRLEELKRIQEELKRIQEEKRIVREEKKKIVIENAKKQGYIVKQEVTEDNRIRIVLQKRIY